MNELKLLKNIHKGRTAFMIGNGPSVRISDLAKMGDNVSFCCNKFYMAYDMTKFRPTYTVASDRQMIGDFGDEIVKKTEGRLLLALDDDPLIAGDYTWIRLKHFKPQHLFKKPIFRYVLPGGATLIVAIQIAYFMGITKFYLYGVDHDFNFEIDENEKDIFRKAVGDKNHFIPNYRSDKKWCPPNTNQIEEAFQICDRFMRSRGGWIKNATRGGKLEVLEREDFDQAVLNVDQKAHPTIFQTMKATLAGFVNKSFNAADSNGQKLFCSEPFEHFEVNENGDVYVCCPGWVNKSIGNLNRSTVDEIWNSKEVQEIRESILDGNFKYCKSEFCGQLKNKTLPAIDEVADPIYKDIILGRKTRLDYGPKLMNLGYDRTCNLHCPSCRNELMVFKGEKRKKAESIQKKILDSNLDSLRRVVLSGHGDPFASHSYMGLLTNFDVEKYPELKVRLFTNGQLFTPKMWEKLKPIHSAIDEVFISIDAATAHTYSVLRAPGDFDLLLENLKFIGELRKENEIDFLRISFVVQKINYREMKDFVLLGKKHNCDLIYFSQIRNWNTYTKAEFKKIAVHERRHPEHPEFVEILRDPLFRDPSVNLNTLANLTDCHSLAPADTIDPKTEAIVKAAVEKTSLDAEARNAVYKIAASTIDLADVFVYDTSKDSDGGAWRRRTQDTSWYNSPADADNNGNTKSFPSIALIVAEADEITIYDATNSNMQIWRTFSPGNIGAAGDGFWRHGRHVTSIEMLNGIMAFGVNIGRDDGANGLCILNFPEDTFGRYPRNKGTSYGGMGSPLVAADTAILDDSLPVLIDGCVNDVDIKVLPNSPANNETGLAKPTIAVATEGGVSWITNDGNVFHESKYGAMKNIKYIGSNEWNAELVSGENLVIKINSTG